MNIKTDSHSSCFKSSPIAGRPKRCSWSNSGRGSETDLYFFDFSQKIGNRPVVMNRPKETPPPKLVRRANLLDRDITCSQPYWGKECI